MLLLTSTHTSRGIDYCQRKDNRFYKPLIGAGAASGQIEKWCLRRCFIGGPTGAFCHGRESCNDWRHSKAPAETYCKPSGLPDHQHYKSTKEYPKHWMVHAGCILSENWEKLFPQSPTYPLLTPPLLHCSTLLAQCCTGFQLWYSHTHQSVTELSSRQTGETGEKLSKHSF